MQVLSQQGDTLDLVCWRFYGNTNSVEAALMANPKLAFLPVILPTGTVVDLPDITQQTSSQINTIQLWD